MYAAEAFAGESNIVGGIVHLGLHPRSGFEAPYRRPVGFRAEVSQMFFDDGVTPAYALFDLMIVV
jgi:hypothetical protein